MNSDGLIKYDSSTRTFTLEATSTDIGKLQVLLQAVDNFDETIIIQYDLVFEITCEQCGESKYIITESTIPNEEIEQEEEPEDIEEEVVIEEEVKDNQEEDDSIEEDESSQEEVQESESSEIEIDEDFYEENDIDAELPDAIKRMIAENLLNRQKIEIKIEVEPLPLKVRISDIDEIGKMEIVFN
jgi:hypothetical protein